MQWLREKIRPKDSFRIPTKLFANRRNGGLRVVNRRLRVERRMLTPPRRYILRSIVVEIRKA